jgi:hypothetical protein
MDDQEPNDLENWKAFPKDFLALLKRPRRHITFVFFFFSIIVGLGGCSIFFAICKEFFGVSPFRNASETTNAMATYVLALSAASIVEILLAAKEKKPHRMVCITIAIIGASIALWSQVVSSVFASLLCAIPGVFSAWLLWWVANADNPSLDDSPPPANAATGGEPTKPPQGSLTGLTV